MTDYCDPKTVNGPKKHVANVHVIYDGGEDDCAVAQLEWDGQPGVGIRWNGNRIDQPLGSPQSRGHPFWFLVPDPFGEIVIQRARELAPESELDVAYREMASDAEREQEATEWSEALIGDAASASR
jgi:hypothetical protein